MQLINDISVPGMPTSPSWMPNSSDGIDQSHLPFGSHTPNLNIFDLFQSDPSMFNMLDSTFPQDAQQAQQQQPPAQKLQSPWSITDPTITPLEGAIGDALQMWSDAPLGFE